MGSGLFSKEAKIWRTPKFLSSSAFLNVNPIDFLTESASMKHGMSTTWPILMIFLEVQFNIGLHICIPGQLDCLGPIIVVFLWILNILSQNIGLSKTSQQDLLKSWQVCRFSKSQVEQNHLSDVLKSRILDDNFHCWVVGFWRLAEKLILKRYLKKC